MDLDQLTRVDLFSFDLLFFGSGLLAVVLLKPLELRLLYRAILGLIILGACFALGMSISLRYGIAAMFCFSFALSYYGYFLWDLRIELKKNQPARPFRVLASVP